MRAGPASRLLIVRRPVAAAGCAVITIVCLAVGGQASSAATASPCLPVLTADSHRALRSADSLASPVVTRLLTDLANPIPPAGTSRVVARTYDGVAGQVTTMRNLDGSIDDRFDVPNALTGGLTLVWSGAASMTSVAGDAVIQAAAQFDIDVDALGSFLATHPSGALAGTTNVIQDPTKPAPGTKKVVTVKLTNFLPEAGDPHGPRNGSYTHIDEPGIGGSLVFQDSLLLLPCPPNPNQQVADTEYVSRWYNAGDGTVHGRSDTKAGGGQIPAAGEYLEGTCFTAPQLLYDVEKLEDGSGQTVAGRILPQPPPAEIPCDPVLGPMPSVIDNSTDYDFNSTVTFPGQW